MTSSQGLFQTQVSKRFPRSNVVKFVWLNYILIESTGQKNDGTIQKLTTVGLPGVLHWFHLDGNLLGGVDLDNLGCALVLMFPTKDNVNIGSKFYSAREGKIRFEVGSIFPENSKSCPSKLR